MPKKQPKTARQVAFDPNDWSTWTHEDFVANARRMQAEDAAKPPPTAEELEMAERFMRKQESACGWNQVDPNAD